MLLGRLSNLFCIYRSLSDFIHRKTQPKRFWFPTRQWKNHQDLSKGERGFQGLRDDKFLENIVLRHINRVDQSSQAVHINLHKHLKIFFLSKRYGDDDIENDGGNMAHNTLPLLKILTPRPSAPEQNNINNSAHTVSRLIQSLFTLRRDFSKKNSYEVNNFKRSR